jgi:hypothetical protein
MSSVFNGSTKGNVNDIGYYINVGTLFGKVSAYNASTSTLSTAVWAATAATPISTQLGTAGSAVLKDMGKTLLSSGRTFRKVQLVNATAANSSVTFGVAGKASTTPNEDYYTGYIELGFEGAGANPAPVAHFGR